MTIPSLYALLERLAANADEHKRFRDAAEIRDGMKCLAPHVEAAKTWDRLMSNSSFMAAGRSRRS